MRGHNRTRKIVKGIAGLALLFVILSGCSVETKQTAQMIEDQIENVTDSANPYVLAVKGGYQEDNPDQLYGDTFEQFFAGPTWTYFLSDTDEHVVEFTGMMMYMDTEVKARLQFIVDDESDTIEVGALSFNDVPQTELIKLSVLTKVFEDGSAASGTEGQPVEGIEEIAESTQAPMTDANENIEGMYAGQLEGISLVLGDSTELIAEHYGEPVEADYYEGGLYFSYSDVVFLTSAARAEDGTIEHGKIISIALPRGASIGGVVVGDTFDEIEAVMGEGYRYGDEEGSGWYLEYAYGDYVVSFSAQEEAGDTMSMEYHHAQYAVPYS
ncbi:hypothetical protein [Paenibacillus sp. 2TAB19]|uniref:hypothetical protein n=1 Tax=Paenibacillus sp. 2TAB19 TaxID=3233003 RepID=UPI003F955C9C